MHSAVQPHCGEYLFRMIHRYKPQNILELGTCFGISTLYMHCASTASRIITIEGSPAIADIAQDIFTNIGNENIHLICGKFAENIDDALQQFPQLDFAFFDGHHTKEATLHLFNTCLSKAHNDSIFVFDDIHLSTDMEAAWKTIKSHNAIQLTIDLFNFGIVFFKREIRHKNHLVLVPARWKPWMLK